MRVPKRRSTNIEVGKPYGGSEPIGSIKGLEGNPSNDTTHVYWDKPIGGSTGTIFGGKSKDFEGVDIPVDLGNESPDGKGGKRAEWHDEAIIANQAVATKKLRAMRGLDTLAPGAKKRKVPRPAPKR